MALGSLLMALGLWLTLTVSSDDIYEVGKSSRLVRLTLKGM